MELVKEEVDYFVEYVLLDKAFREAAKRQTKNISGFWVGYLQSSARKKGRAIRRGSDLRERRYVCIEVLHRTGDRPIANAAAEVADKIYKSSLEDVEKIRTDYYNFKKSNPGDLVSRWIGQFLFWRDWVLSSREEMIQSALEPYQEKYGKLRRKRLEELMKDIRSDKDQASRNREWCEEQLTDYAISAAAHLVELGRFHLKLDQQQKALEPFKYALALWKTHGGHWPDRQAQAISELEDKISRILKDEPVDPQLRAEWWLPQGPLPVKEEGAAVLREQSEEASVKSLFDAYLMIDWSASSTPKQGRDSVWYCLVRREAGRIRMEVLRNPSTRCEAAEQIRKLLVELSSNNLATLVGFDFTYGYPAGLASKLGLVGAPWHSIWQELQR